jgi:hypothetical protein
LPFNNIDIVEVNAWRHTALQQWNKNI